MPFDKMMIAGGDINLKMYRKVLEKVPNTFTEDQAHEAVKSRRGLTEPDLEETKKILRKMRKMLIIRAENPQNRYKQTTYTIINEHYKNKEEKDDQANTRS